MASAIHSSSLLVMSISVALFCCLASLSHVVSGSRALSTERTEFIVRGRVFCDTCRAGFETPATNYISGAKVKVECRRRDTGEVTYTTDGVTDATGTYNIPVANDHEAEICEALLTSSPENSCSEQVRGRERAQVVLTYNDGIPSNIRFANNMGYQTYTPMSGCSEVMKMYQLDEEDI